MPMSRGVRHVVLFGGGRRLSGAARLLVNEANGLAFDATDMSARVKWPASPDNDFDGDANDLFTYTNPSTKWIRNQAGIYVSGTTLRTEYDTDGTPLGLRVEPARTNLALHSDDFTQEAWTLSDIDAAKTATGPDGVANSASTLTATDANGTALQAITSASAARVTSCFIRRRTGSGDIDLTQDNGDNWTTVTVTSEWTRVSIDAATAANPTVGIRIVTSGDAVDVAFFQHEVGAFVTSPIRTAGATVTRAGDNILAAASAFPSMLPECTIFVEVVPIFITGGAQVYAVANGTNTEGGPNRIMLRSTSQIVQTDGSLSLVQSAPSQEQAGVPYKLAIACAEDDFAVSSDGNAPNTDTSGAMPENLDTGFSLGNSDFVNDNFGGWLKRGLVVPRRMTNTDLQAITSS